MCSSEVLPSRSCECSLLRCRHLMTPQPCSQHGASSPALFGLSIGSPLADGFRERAHGYETLSPLSNDKVRRLSVVFRRPRSRPPMLSPCGAVLPSTARAAGAFSRRSLLPEATPVSRCRCSSCRQRQKAIRHRSHQSPGLCKR